MNYDEMLKSSSSMAQHREQLPLGFFCRKQIEGKYRNALQLKPEWTDSLTATEGLRRDRQFAFDHRSRHQLKYEFYEDSSGIVELDFEPGNYQSLAHLLADEPATLARKDFIKNILNGLFDATEELHQAGILHLCFAPSTVFLRKGDDTPLLLCHGSSLLGVKDQHALYQGFETMVAPEVLDGSTKPDERSDVYALGRFIEQLFLNSNLPYEYKAVVKRATDDDPAQRYDSVAAMRKAIDARKTSRKSLLAILGAAVVAGLLVWLFFDLMPETSNVEFIDDNGVVQKEDPYQQVFDDPFVNDQEEYIDPEIALYLDSIGMDEMTDEEFKALSDSVKTATQLEDIFRRRFTQQAEAKLTELYSRQNLGSSETDFISHSGKVFDELMAYAAQLARESGMQEGQASSLASQIISHIQAQKQEELNRLGNQQGGQ